jgi:aspartate racemase
MKKIGLVGGVAWPSTVEYYAGICHLSERRHLSRYLPGMPATPEMAIESLDLNKAVSCLGVDGDEASWSRFDEYHRTALQRLEASGAEFALIASNAPHHRFATITHGVGIPVINLFDAAADACARIGAGHVLILGIAVTMESAKFREGFAARAIVAEGLRDEGARALLTELIEELQLGKCDGAAVRIGGIARRAFEQQFTAAPIVCLACTELPLAFPEAKELPVFEFDGIRYVNTSAVHIAAAFEFATAE